MPDTAPLTPESEALLEYVAELKMGMIYPDRRWDEEPEASRERWRAGERDEVMAHVAAIEAAAIARYAEGHRRLLDKAGRYVSAWVQPNPSKEALLDEIEAALAIPEAQEADRG